MEDTEEALRILSRIAPIVTIGLVAFIALIVFRT